MRDDDFDFRDWWDDLVFYDDEGVEYSPEDYDYEDRMRAIEYLFNEGVDLDELMDMLYEDNDTFWEYYRENYSANP